MKQRLVGFTSCWLDKETAGCTIRWDQCANGLPFSDQAKVNGPRDGTTASGRLSSTWSCCGWTLKAGQSSSQVAFLCLNRSWETVQQRERISRWSAQRCRRARQTRQTLTYLEDYCSLTCDQLQEEVLL